MEPELCADEQRFVGGFDETTIAQNRAIGGEDEDRRTSELGPLNSIA